MRIPLPPGATPQLPQPLTSAPSLATSRSPSDSHQPNPSPSLKQTPNPLAVDRNETSFILRRCLRPAHLSDPNVMRFIASYLTCRDVKQAAREAGLSTKDGNALRKKPDIHEAIVQVTEKACFKVGYDAAEVVAKVKEIMDIDPGDFQREDGTFIENLNEVPPEVRRGVKSFKAKNLYELDPNGMRVCVGKLISVEFWDKLKATELLGRENNLFKETKKVTHDIAKNMSDTLLESRRLGDQAASGMRDITPDFKEVESDETR